MHLQYKGAYYKVAFSLMFVFAFIAGKDSIVYNTSIIFFNETDDLKNT